MLEELICDFYERDIIRLDLDKGFRLANTDAPPSPLYYDLRTPDNPKGGKLTDKDVRAIARLFCDLLMANKVEFAGIAPVPNAAIPFAQAMQQELYTRPPLHLSVPVLLFEKGTTKLKRNPDLAPGNSVLLLDDVISDGKSKEPPIRGIEGAGYRVHRCAVFARRSPKGQSFLLEKFGVALCYLTTPETTLDILTRNRLISGQEKTETLRIMENA